MLQIARVAATHLEQVVVVTGDVVALLHLGQLGDALQERGAMLWRCNDTAMNAVKAKPAASGVTSAA